LRLATHTANTAPAATAVTIAGTITSSNIDDGTRTSLSGPA
jgi:hypothetical protein